MLIVRRWSCPFADEHGVDFETTVLKQANPVVDKPDDEVQRKKAEQEAGFVLEVRS